MRKKKERKTKAGNQNWVRNKVNSRNRAIYRENETLLFTHFRVYEVKAFILNIEKRWNFSENPHIKVLVNQKGFSLVSTLPETITTFETSTVLGRRSHGLCWTFKGLTKDSESTGDLSRAVHSGLFLLMTLNPGWWNSHKAQSTQRVGIIWNWELPAVEQGVYRAHLLKAGPFAFLALVPEGLTQGSTYKQDLVKVDE